MSNDSIPEPIDLPNKPLIEAIFELRWSVQKQGPLSSDPGFPLFQGRYYDRVRHTYPTAVQLPAAALPEDMTAYAPRQQFRAGEKKWPLTQIGPGILTVNETTDYRWETFRPLLQQALEALFGTYPSNISELKPTQGMLRYINVIDYPVSSSQPVLAFLRERLHTTVAPEPKLFDDPAQAESPNGLNLNLAYRLSAPPAIAGVNVALGEANGKPSIIFEILVQSTPNNVPQSPDDFMSWIDAAHAIVDKWFFALIRGPLFEEFQDANGNSGN